MVEDKTCLKRPLLAFVEISFLYFLSVLIFISPFKNACQVLYRSDFNTKIDMRLHYSPFWLQLLASFKVFVGFCLLLWLLGWWVGG